ncbi:MAG TPA: hypothetical protein VLM79_32215 [Kofleriaceae bacterium]|nr:hypothetical protein [Kofleriaceae bacterium]
MLLAVAVLYVRHDGARVGLRSQTPSQAKISPNSTATMKPAMPGSSQEPIPANDAKTSRAMYRSSIPTELPESPSLDKVLSADGMRTDYRESYTYQLGLMSSYQECMNGRIAKGVIYYYIDWQVDENHLASSPAFQRAYVPPEGQVSQEDEGAFATCVNEYLTSHDQVYLPHTGAGGASWGMRAVFPLSDSPLLKMIADAKANREVEDPSAASRPASSTAEPEGVGAGEQRASPPSQ